MEKKYVYAATLKKVYGLTPSMIRELLPADKTCDNPHWKTGPYEASLFLIERVETWVENNKDRLEKARVSREKRSAAMQTVHRKKTTERLCIEQEQLRIRQEQLLVNQEWVRGLAITFKLPFPSTLREDALKRRMFTGNVEAQKERTIKNHIRHRYTNYNKLLHLVSEKPDSHHLYPLLRERVDAAVNVALTDWKIANGLMADASVRASYERQKDQMRRHAVTNVRPAWLEDVYFEEIYPQECYYRAYYYASHAARMEKGVFLVHGETSLAFGGHAWVELPDGLVFDAVYQQFFPLDVWDREAHACRWYKFTASAANLILARLRFSHPGLYRWDAVLNLPWGDPSNPLLIDDQMAQDFLLAQGR